MSFVERFTFILSSVLNNTLVMNKVDIFDGITQLVF